ncbi:MAG: hypothetical protein K9W44_01995 [Candidatus Lokiarchaeota archaeon]|nr:hypothetical protein [Candidatus Harpocratesius repetitus]
MNKDKKENGQSNKKKNNYNYKDRNRKENEDKEENKDRIENKDRKENDNPEVNDDKDNNEEDENVQIIDVSNFFNYQKALNSLMDYLNVAIDETISGFTRSDQLLFSHANKKLILNAILESGFYDFCKMRLAEVAESNAIEDQDSFMAMMTQVQGEIDLLAYLLVNTRLAHRTLNFDLFLSLLKGGLFVDILETHDKIVKDMRNRAQILNSQNIRENVKVSDNSFYI